MAAGSSAFAPKPYTVSVGKATRSPERINCAARASSLREIFFSIARNLSGVLEYQECVHQSIQVAIQHAIHIADRKLGAMVFHHPIRSQDVAADLAAEIDLELRIFDLLIRHALLLQLV